MSKILICNQKMYLTHDEAIEVSKDYDEIDFEGIDLIVCPGYLNLENFKNYTLGVQNCASEDKGAYTGEVSPYDLYLRGVKYAIIGHSERRWCETDEIVNEKVKACIRNSITPIICIGETKIEKEMMKTSSVLKRQITKALKDVNLLENDKVYIAYEPIYKIGSKKPLLKSDIEDTMLYIKKVLSDLKISNYKVLYGGSVKGSFIKDIDSDMIDGYLIGESSVDISDLKMIISSIK